MRLASLASILVLSSSAAFADGPAIAFSGGVGSLYEHHNELVLPLQVRINTDDRFAIEVGRDTTCTDDALCALFGFYRAGAMVFLRHGELAPYGYGRLLYFFSGAESAEPHMYNVGMHYGAGAGLEWMPSSLGAYAEAGVLGDFAGKFLAPTFAAGVTYRFYSRSR